MFDELVAIYAGNIAQRYFRNHDKAPYEAARMNERHVRVEICISLCARLSQNISLLNSQSGQRKHRQAAGIHTVSR